MTRTVFVYGTLKRGESAAHRMMECIYLGSATTFGVLYDLGSFPALKLGGMEIVYGELFKLPPNDHDHFRVLQQLDRYEGVPVLYQRCRTTVFLDGSEPHEAHIYEYSHEPSAEQRIVSGRWSTVPA